MSLGSDSEWKKEYENTSLPTNMFNMEYKELDSKFIISADLLDNEYHTYCLTKIVNDNYEIILQKSHKINNIQDKINFEKAVNQLSEFFDAEKLIWK